jgi:PAS domain S-box-containing protein
MNHFYQSIMMNSSTGYAHYRIIRNTEREPVDLRILEVNPSYEQMMGIAGENLAGRKVSELGQLIPDEWPVESIKFYDRTAKAGNGLVQTLEFQVESLQKKYQITVVSVAEDEVICRYHDITRVTEDYLVLKKLEDELKEQLALSSLFFTHSIASLFYMMIDEPVIWDDTVDKNTVMDYVFHHHRITRVNPAMETMYRTTADKLEGASSYDLFDQDINTCKRVWEELFNKGRAQIYTEKQRFDGSMMCVKGDYITLNDDEGRITGLYGIQVDITAQKEAEDALIKNSELLRFSQELGKVGGFEYDVNTRKVRWTDEMYRIHDLDASQPEIPRDLMALTLDCMEPGDRERLQQAIEDMQSSGDRFDLETSLTTAAGNRRWVRITARPVDKNGMTERVVGSMLDISKQKEMELKLHKALEAAEFAVQSRTMFLASMSHEIRNPVHGIMGMLQLLKSTPLNDEQKELMQFSQTSSEALLRIIDDILDYSKIESGALELEEIPFNLHVTLQEVKGIFTKLAAEKELEIILEIDEAIPEKVKGDPYRFSQVLNNLMSNAVKYTKRGEIRIKAELEQPPADHLPGEITLKIAVQDTGSGIPEGKMSLLFQVFTQADPSNTRLYGGTGLGLAIAKNIVEHMRGKIWAESTWGKGSLFAFTCRMKMV